MHRSRNIMLAALVAVSALALVGAGAAAAADRYVPFVTDFPTGQEPAEPYRPFATDFGITPRPAGGGFVSRAASPEQASSGREWGDVALGGAAGIALAALVATAALGLRTARLHGGRRERALEPQAAPPQ